VVGAVVGVVASVGESELVSGSDINVEGVKEEGGVKDTVACNSVGRNVPAGPGDRLAYFGLEDGGVVELAVVLVRRPCYYENVACSVLEEPGLCCPANRPTTSPPTTKPSINVLAME